MSDLEFALLMERCAAPFTDKDVAEWDKRNVGQLKREVRESVLSAAQSERVALSTKYVAARIEAEKDTDAALMWRLAN